MTLTKEEIQAKVDTLQLSAANKEIVVTYLLKNPKKWSEEKFSDDVNALLPTIFAESKKTTYTIWGMLFAAIIFAVIGVIYWIFMSMRNKNVRETVVLPTPEAYTQYSI